MSDSEENTLSNSLSSSRAGAREQENARLDIDTDQLRAALKWFDEHSQIGSDSLDCALHNEHQKAIHRITLVQTINLIDIYQRDQASSSARVEQIEEKASGAVSATEGAGSLYSATSKLSHAIRELERIRALTSGLQHVHPRDLQDFDQSLEAIRSCAASSWLPIESAPKDGLFLVYEDGAMRMMLRDGGYWKATAVVGDQFGDAVESLGHRQVKVRETGVYNPTHWMLPAPPESK